MADREGVRIFQADIIYHLFDRWAPHTILIVSEYCENGRLSKAMCKSSRPFREVVVKKCSCLVFVRGYAHLFIQTDKEKSHVSMEDKKKKT